MQHQRNHEWDHNKIKLFSYESVDIFSESIELLDYNHWINSDIITFMLEYFKNDKQKDIFKEKKIEIISPLLTPLLEIQDFKEVGADELKLKEMHFIVHPINVVNMHWAFLYLDLDKRQGFYLDSMKEAYHFPQQLIAKYQDYYHFEIRFQTQECEQQENSYDCGVQVIYYMDKLLAELSGNKIDAIDPKNQRNQIKTLIVEHSDKARQAEQETLRNKFIEENPEVRFGFEFPSQQSSPMRMQDGMMSQDGMASEAAALPMHPAANPTDRPYENLSDSPNSKLLYAPKVDDAEMNSSVGAINDSNDIDNLSGNIDLNNPDQIEPDTYANQENKIDDNVNKGNDQPTNDIVTNNAIINENHNDNDKKE